MVTSSKWMEISWQFTNTYAFTMADPRRLVCIYRVRGLWSKPHRDEDYLLAEGD